MGKGKGKLASWVSELSAGVIIFELKNLRPGRASYFLNQIKHRLPVKTKITTYYSRFIGLPINNSKKISFFTLW